MLRLLGRSHELRPLVAWSLQTGGVVSAIEALPPLRDPAVTDYHRITYSTNGKIVGVLRQYETPRVDGRIIGEFGRGPTFATISIYNVVSGVYLGDVNHGLDSPYIFGIWTHGESLRFATFRSKTFTVHEVGFTPGASPTVVKTLPIPDLSGRTAVLEMVVPDSAIRVRSLPFKFRSASVDPSPVDGALVWDARDPATGSALNFSRMSFSSGCRFFACPGTESETHLWRESPTGYVLQGKFASSTEFSKPLLSPSGESIITVGVLRSSCGTQKPLPPPLPSTQPLLPGTPRVSPSNSSTTSHWQCSHGEMMTQWWSSTSHLVSRS